jgi:hypothetical protein
MNDLWMWGGQHCTILSVPIDEIKVFSPNILGFAIDRCNCKNSMLTADPLTRQFEFFLSGLQEVLGKFQFSMIKRRTEYGSSVHQVSFEQ